MRIEEGLPAPARTAASGSRMPEAFGFHAAGRVVRTGCADSSDVRVRCSMVPAPTKCLVGSADTPDGPDRRRVSHQEARHLVAAAITIQMSNGCLQRAVNSGPTPSNAPTCSTFGVSRNPPKGSGTTRADQRRVTARGSRMCRLRCWSSTFRVAPVHRRCRSCIRCRHRYPHLR